MNRTLLKKSLSEGQWLLLACTATLFSFCWLRVWIVGHIEMQRFQIIVEQFREYERFSPVPFEQLFTYEGRIALSYSEPIVVLCVLIWAIARGSDTISGELGRGTMEMLLAQPVSRLQVLLAPTLITVAGIALLVLAAWLGTYVGVATTTVKEEVTPTWTIPLLGLEVPNPLAPKQERIVPLSEKVDPYVFLPAAVNLFSLGLLLAGLSTLMSSWDRYRSRTIGIVVGIFILQLILKIVGLALDDFQWVLWLTFLTAYEPEMFVSVAVNSPQQTWSILRYDDHGRWLDLGPLGYSLLLILLSTVAYLAAALIFWRRDVPAPL